MSSINFDFTADSQPRRQAVQCCTEGSSRHRRFVSSTTRRNVRDGLGPVGAAAVMSDTNSPAQAQAERMAGRRQCGRICRRLDISGPGISTANFAPNVTIAKRGGAPPDASSRE